MATIKPIDGRSVHQIQSGQVIVDLQSVCKELVENSIDAGATAIEVRFKNNGLDSIEVQDNGSGISPDDYETIALKHYTSKLATYNDLSSLQTFGFRGEALSSLCALSHFHVVTARASDGPKGTKLEFEQSGKLKSTSIVAAKQGTTIAVETLFYNLPVRRKELEKNIKREYNRVLQLLNAYACISVGVKFSVSNQVPKGKKTVAFSTNANSSTRDNISNVYGAKAVTALLPLSLKFEMDASSRPGAIQTLKDWNMHDNAGSRMVKIEGHISRPVVGEGRQTPDRQMFFVNTRPCTLPQVAKAFNEVYKSFNVTQSPFIFADIKLDTNAYDVNVSPDKRSIMLHDQMALLEQLKEALLDLFDNHDQSVPQAQLSGRKPPMSGLRPPSLHLRDSTLSVPIEDRRQAEAILSTHKGSSAGALEPAILNVPGSVSGAGFVKASLIERLAERDAEERTIPPSATRNSTGLIDSTAVEERSSYSNVRQTSAPPEDKEPTAHVTRTRSPSPLFESEHSDVVTTQLWQPSKVVRDFNARIASQQAHKTGKLLVSDSADAKEPPKSIPTFQQTSRKFMPQSSMQSAFDRMRPLSTPIQQATITVGDRTTVSTIGTGNQSTSLNHVRSHTPRLSSSGQRLHQTPLLRKGTSSFADPGIQGGSSDEEEDISIDSPYSAELDASVLSQSALERSLAGASEKTQTDGLVEPLGTLRPCPVTITDETPVVEPQPEADLILRTQSDVSDGLYIAETKQKAREEETIAQMIVEAEENAARPTEMNLKRANKLFKVPQKKYWTVNLRRVVTTDARSLKRYTQNVQAAVRSTAVIANGMLDLSSKTQLDQEDPEERLSLTVSKLDFNEMRVVGQFNLGFIIAIRPPTSTSSNSDLFIIDQHASDEKYNFERLSATTTLVSQRLVHAHPLELTAVEAEIILANEHALSANGFVVEMHAADGEHACHLAKLTSLPMSKEVTFTPTDLEELLALILENPSSSSTSMLPHIPRPSKVRKLLASRACRSSVMIGKTLQHARMKEIVRHMGSMDKPWSCPHGRPTMRHLYGLEQWQNWTEGDGVTGIDTPGQNAD